jgi:hypothetical protein
MATMPAFLTRTPARREHPRPQAEFGDAQRAVRDAFLLRPLPQEDVYFHCKTIDNSRLVREPDPRARGAAWSAFGAAAVLAGILMASQVPSVMGTVAGYKLQALRAEESRYLDERRSLELQEASLLSQDRLQQLAQGQNLVTPSARQVFHLDGKPDGAVAMVH